HMIFPRHPVFGHHLMGDWDHTGTRDVEAICGAFMMVRREVAQRLGGLPEDLFMYHEDLSFCLRLRRAGWTIRYLGDFTTTHYWRRSSGRSYTPLDLLEGEHKLLLIRESQGSLAAAVGRGVFVVRSMIRLAIAGAGTAVPERAGLRDRYPRVFDARRHALQLAWGVAPKAVHRFFHRSGNGTSSLSAG
ncbi:MAG: glycosyltransferase family 2 protein, partial [Longimicrobiales bacterium]